MTILLHLDTRPADLCRVSLQPPRSRNLSHMQADAAVVAVWAVAVLVLVAILRTVFVAPRGDGRASGGGGSAVGPGAAGAVYDLLNQDKRNAIELIVEDKAAARDPEDADGNLPDLENPRPRRGARSAVARTAPQASEGVSRGAACHRSRCETVVTYALRYEYPSGAKPDLTTLKVAAVVWPAAVVRAQLADRAAELANFLLPARVLYRSEVAQPGVRERLRQGRSGLRGSARVDAAKPSASALTGL